VIAETLEDYAKMLRAANRDREGEEVEAEAARIRSGS